MRTAIHFSAVKAGEPDVKAFENEGSPPLREQTWKMHDSERGQPVRRHAIYKFFDTWRVVALRGLFAMALAVLIFLTQTFTRDWWMEPFVLPFVILVLGLYGLIDSALVFGIAARLPQRYALTRVALLQGISGFVVGIGLLTVLFAKADITWFAILAGTQALLTGLYELWIAVHIRRHRTQEKAVLAAAWSSIAAAALLYVVYKESTYEVSRWLIGYGLVMGMNFLWAASRLRRLANRYSREQSAAP
jgi:hypothetical protein